MADVVGYIAKSIDNFDTEQLNALHWRNGEVLEVLQEILAGLAAEPAPTWAEVTISEVMAERDELRRDVERGRTVVKNAADLASSSPLSMQEATEALLRTTDVWFQMVDAQAAEKRLRGELRSLEGNTAAATVLWETVAEQLRGERDRARATAVRLEQELAQAEKSLASSWRWFVFKDSGRWWVSLRNGSGELEGTWREFKSRRKAVRFAQLHSGEAS
ncbi:hypothetical protein [Glaciibacter superstes]|uniref:hypothetical protein n=1 Tax=Glaciibacter superstes TaxID=501023 RepID=UPI0012FC8404|nr:hypothetical protein [Glaciibacter superstes]